MSEKGCTVRVHSADHWLYHECGRPLKPGSDKCGIHTAADKRREANQAKRDAEARRREAQQERLRQAAAEFEGVYHVRVRPHHDHFGNLTGEFVISEDELRKLVRGRG